MAGGIRDVFMLKDFHLLWGFIAIFVAVLVGNLIRGKFNWGFEGQPVAFNTLVSGNALWAILGMFLVGFASILLGGCPLRQLVLAGSGSSDATMAVLGMTVGAAFCHNFGFASSGDGTTANGHIAVIIGIVVTLVIALANCKKVED